MLSEHQRKRLEVEDAGDVTRVVFLDRIITKEQDIQMIGEELFSLVDEQGKKKIILDFANLEYLATDAFGKLITLQKKVSAADGKLVLCNISKDIYEIFEIVKLNKILTIVKDEKEAMELKK